MQLSAEKIWNSAQEQLRSKLSKDTYNMWFAPLRVCAMDNSQVTLETPNEFCELWLKDNYLSLLQDAVAVAASRQLQVKFKIGTGTAPTMPVPPSAPVPSPARTKSNEVSHERSSSTGDLPFNP